jgi:hypothetical protein
LFILPLLRVFGFQIQYDAALSKDGFSCDTEAGYCKGRAGSAAMAGVRVNKGLVARIAPALISMRPILFRKL